MMSTVKHASSQALDPQLASLLEAMPYLTAPVLRENLDEIRRRAGQVRMTDEELSGGGAVSVSELTVPAAGGTELTVLLMRPCDVPAEGLVCYLHGGGLITGDERTGAELLVDWVVHTGLACASVGYRLAPEHPFPVPVEDCYAALCWLADWRSGARIGGGPLVLAGTSAGGGLAAATALLSRERGGPAIDAQMLMSPMLDDRMTWPSSRHEARQVWDRRSNQTGWSCYLGDRFTTGRDVPPAAAPARERDLKGLPPGYLDVGSAELFRDEVVDYAGRLAQAGAPVELHVWGGAFHGFEHFAPDAAISGTTRQVRRDYLNRLVSGSRP